jgi:ABC-2 type transport system permease protein
MRRLGGPAHLLRAAPTLLRVGFAEMVAYRAEMVIWILTATLPLVMLALWSAAAEEGPLMGFGQAEFARYFTVNLVLRQLTGAWVVWELNYQVRDGSLSPMLLRPLNPLLWNLATTLAAIPFRLVVLAPIVGLLLWWRPDIAFVPSGAQALAFALSLPMAFLLSWLVQCAFGCLAFWFEQSMGMFQVYNVVWGFLGGYLVPVALLPAGLLGLATWSPFRASFGTALDLLLGLSTDPARDLLVQAGWVGAAAALVWWLWRRGVRRYGAVGA